MLLVLPEVAPTVLVENCSATWRAAASWIPMLGPFTGLAVQEGRAVGRRILLRMCCLCAKLVRQSSCTAAMPCPQASESADEANETGTWRGIHAAIMPSKQHT